MLTHNRGKLPDKLHTFLTHVTPALHVYEYENAHNTASTTTQHSHVHKHTRAIIHTLYSHFDTIQLYNILQQFDTNVSTVNWFY